VNNERDAREFLRELQQVAAEDRLERAEWERDVAAKAAEEAKWEAYYWQTVERDYAKAVYKQADEEELAIMLRRQAAEQEWEFAGRCARHGTPLLGDNTCLECEAERADEVRNDH